jgi:two-component system response regulator (stage 0 sporulation protein F)
LATAVSSPTGPVCAPRRRQRRQFPITTSIFGVPVGASSSGGILALLHLPMNPDQGPRGPAKTPTSTGGHRRATATIMVVDDDTQWLADLQTWLTHDGYEVVGISRGEWVVQAVDFHEPDVVLLDLNFPEADGLAILGHLQRRQPELPVVIMTAFGNIDIENRARALGAVAYFDKPFRLDALLRTLRSICRPESAA